MKDLANIQYQTLSFNYSIMMTLSRVPISVHRSNINHQHVLRFSHLMSVETRVVCVEAKLQSYNRVVHL